MLFLLFTAVITVNNIKVNAKDKIVSRGVHHSSDSEGNVFLGGNYMEIGINKRGSFGSTAAPTPFENWNFNNYDKGTKLGLTSNSNGWGYENELTAGDFFVPGTPEERYILSYRIGEKEYNINVAYLNNSYNASDWKVEPTVTDTTEGNNLSAKVTGITKENVTLNIYYAFNVDSLHYTTKVKIINNNEEEIKDVRFVRSFDPDQDQWLYGTYKTYNKVICNPDPSIPGNETNCAVVVALGAKSFSGLFFLSMDNRARASRGVAFSPTSAYLKGLWDDAPITEVKYPSDDVLSFSLNKTNGYILEDNAIALTTNFGTISSGSSDETDYFTSLNSNVSNELQTIKEVIFNSSIY